MLGDNRDRLADQVFDTVKVFALIDIAEGTGDAGCARPRGTSDAMHITLRHIRQVKVDDVGHRINIQAARGDVRCHQYRGPPGLELGQGLHPRGLRFVAVNRFCRNARVVQLFRQVIGAMLGAGEDKYPFGSGILQDMFEQSPFFRRFPQNREIGRFSRQLSLLDSPRL